jgi:hypothetical protein
MFLLYRKGEPVSVEQAMKEFHDAATDAGIDHATPDEILAGALAGDAADQESLYDFVGVTCAQNEREALQIDRARERPGD